MIRIDRLDHLVLTVASVERTCAFYGSVLDMQIEEFAEGRKALRFGNQKINLHERGHEFEPKARVPMPGSADLCFIAASPLAEVIARLNDLGIPIERGPVARAGATGELRSVYLRDPDENLIELATY